MLGPAMERDSAATCMHPTFAAAAHAVRSRPSSRRTSSRRSRAAVGEPARPGTRTALPGGVGAAAAEGQQTSAFPVHRNSSAPSTRARPGPRQRVPARLDAQPSHRSTPAAARTRPCSFGFDQRSNGIPAHAQQTDATSKNRQLGAAPANWTKGGVDERVLSEAFVAAHSKAEVYRLETIEKVFGDVGKLDPTLLEALLGTMRAPTCDDLHRPSGAGGRQDQTLAEGDADGGRARLRPPRPSPCAHSPSAVRTGRSAWHWRR